jgi:two-component system, NarL family, sensor histidine kinase UhpB
MSKQVTRKPGPLHVTSKPSNRRSDDLRSGVAYSYLHHLLEAEKIQLSRDLHDSFGQELTILKMGLAEIIKASRRNERVKAECRKLSDVVDNLIQNVRRVSTDLHPSLLEEDGLFPTLEWYFARFERQTGLRCRWRRSKREPDIQPDKATQIFRIVQEALTNVARHAQARSIAVETNVANEEFTVVIRDNGRGIEEEKIRDYRSIGLMNMTERARLIGGRLDISGSSGQGTLVRLAIPLQHCSAVFGTSQNQVIVQQLNEALAEQFRLIARGKAIHEEIRNIRSK